MYLPVKLTDRKSSTKKEIISSYLIHNIVSLSTMTGKAEPFLVKDKLNMKM